jgi:hypothetical protein
MKKWIYDHSLSIVLFALFFVFIAGLSVTGHRHENNELEIHGQTTMAYAEYLRSPEFGEAVFENWESEFLQMGALVVFTIWFRQKGSADSKKLKGENAVDTESRYSIIHASTWSNRKKAIKSAIYGNSLSLALFSLFIISFVLHAVNGVSAANQEALAHGEGQVGFLGYMASSQFWFESFQNWQSEFLAVGALLVLSIFLRQRKSPESKPVGQPNARTGS